MIPVEVSSERREAEHQRGQQRLAIAAAEIGVLVLAHGVVDLAQENIFGGDALLSGTRGEGQAVALSNCQFRFGGLFSRWARQFNLETCLSPGE